MITCPTSRTSSLRTQETRTSPSCSTRTLSSPILRSSHFKKPHPAKMREAWCYSLFAGLLRRPSLSGTPAVQFCSVHIHNDVTKKRDASTDLLRRLHAHMQQHNVDFIGGDFNMSAFSTVGDVLADPQFSAPGNSFLWGPRCAGGGESRVHGVSHCAEATIRVVCGFTWLPQVQQRGSCTWAS